MCVEKFGQMQSRKRCGICLVQDLPAGAIVELGAHCHFKGSLVHHQAIVLAAASSVACQAVAWFAGGSARQSGTVKNICASAAISSWDEQ